MNGLHISLDVGWHLNQEKRFSTDWVEGQNTWQSLAYQDMLLSSEQRKKKQQKLSEVFQYFLWFFFSK